MDFLKPVVQFTTTVLLFIAFTITGCDNSESNTSTPAQNTDAPKTQVTEDQAKPAPQPLIPVAKMVDWCREHRMPESICVQCNPELAAGFKAKGDWDEKHNLPKSQCFQCDPSLKEKFAAAFKEKTGTEPPATE